MIDTTVLTGDTARLHRDDGPNADFGEQVARVVRNDRNDRFVSIHRSTRFGRIWSSGRYHRNRNINRAGRRNKNADATSLSVTIKSKRNTTSLAETKKESPRRVVNQRPSNLERIFAAKQHGASSLSGVYVFYGSPKSCGRHARVFHGANRRVDV